MNWIINKSQKMFYHTDLSIILKPLWNYIDNYNWILSDIKGGDWAELPIDYEHDYFILSPEKFKKILSNNVQFYWGVILAVPISVEIKIEADNLPYADGNKYIWENGNLQYPGAEFEIVCVDSSYTIVKFSNQDISNKFIEYFIEAKPLEKFTHKYLRFVK